MLDCKVLILSFAILDLINSTFSILIFQISYNILFKGGEYMKKQANNRVEVDFTEADIKLATTVLNKIRDIYSFFNYLKEKRDLPFAIVLIKSDHLKDLILKEKRKTDVYADLDITGINLIFIPVTKENECDGFVRRMMSGIEEDSGDFASIIKVKKNANLEETVFSLIIDYLMILKQPKKWRTGQVSYKEI